MIIRQKEREQNIAEMRVLGYFADDEKNTVIWPIYTNNVAFPIEAVSGSQVQ